MKKNRALFKHIPLKLVLLTTVLALVVAPDKFIVSCYQGLMLFAVNVLPALLPFFFFTKLLTALGLADDCGLLLGGAMRKLYGAPPCSAYVFAMSIISGYPIGAKLTADLSKAGVIDKNEAQTICAFSSTSGPMFILGSVGAVMLGDKYIGAIILISHYLSAVLNGFLYRNGNKKNSSRYIPALKINNLLADCIYSSVISVLAVGAYIAIFYMLADVLSAFGIIKILSAPLSLFLPETLAQNIVEGLVEMTRGCNKIAQSGISLSFAVPAMTALITFGGLSVTLQSLTFLKETQIRVSYYLLTKLTQTAISVAVAILLTLLFL